MSLIEPHCDVWTLILTAPIHCRASIAETLGAFPLPFKLRIEKGNALMRFFRQFEKGIIRGSAMEKLFSRIYRCDGADET